MTLSMRLFLIGILALSCLSTSIFKGQQDNSTKVKNIILMGTVALSTRENTHNLDVTLP